MNSDNLYLDNSDEKSETCLLCEKHIGLKNFPIVIRKALQRKYCKEKSKNTNVNSIELILEQKR